jgi:hypothetical protein
MADVLPHATVVHAIEGRTRLRVAERRGDAAFFASAATGLSTIAGVKKVDVTPLTGGILIFHDAPLSGVAETAEKLGLFLLIEETPDSSQAPALRITPRMVAATGLGLVAAWQVYKERVFPPALTIAWYAVNIAGFLSAEGASSADE